jgi:hypothetical protein
MNPVLIAELEAAGMQVKMVTKGDAAVGATISMTLPAGRQSPQITRLMLTVGPPTHVAMTSCGKMKVSWDFGPRMAA